MEQVFKTFTYADVPGSYTIDTIYAADRLFIDVSGGYSSGFNSGGVLVKVKYINDQEETVGEVRKIFNSNFPTGCCYDFTKPVGNGDGDISAGLYANGTGTIVVEIGQLDEIPVQGSVTIMLTKNHPTGC